MGGFFGVASKSDCLFDLFFGTDYHSHLGTRRGGMAVYGPDGFDRAIHNIENAPFRTKFEKDMQKMKGKYWYWLYLRLRTPAIDRPFPSWNLCDYYRWYRSTTQKRLRS